MITQSNAALRIALLRASLSRRRSSARQRSTLWPMRPPRLFIVASSVSSGSRFPAARNSTAAITSEAPWIGKQNAAASPQRTAIGARGKFGSAPTSTIQAGSPLAQTRPGSPSPGASDRLRVTAPNCPGAFHVSMQRSSPAPVSVQTAPASHPSDSPIAASSSG